MGAYLLPMTIHLWNINAQIYNYIHFAYEAMLAVKEYQRHFLFMYYVTFGILYNFNVSHASWIIVFRNVIPRTKAYSFFMLIYYGTSYRFETINNYKMTFLSFPKGHNNNFYLDYGKFSTTLVWIRKRKWPCKISIQMI